MQMVTPVSACTRPSRELVSATASNSQSLGSTAVYLLIFSLLWSASCGSAEPPQSAEARDGGIAVNASGNAKVEIHQTIEQYDPEVSALLKRLLKDSKRMQRELTQLRDSSEELRRQLLTQQAGGIDEVMRQARGPNPSSAALDAKRGLERGDTASAEALLREDETAAAAKQPPDLRRAAALARQAGALATFRDTKAALAAYQRAADYEPDNPDNWWMVGNLLMDSLRRAEAEQAYRRLMEIASQRARDEPMNGKWRAMLGVGYRQVAGALLAQEDVTNAVPLAEQSLALAEQWPAAGRESREARSELILSLMLVARVRMDQGELALNSGGEGLPGANRLAAMMEAVARSAEQAQAVFQRALTQINTLLDRNVDDDDLWLKHARCHIGVAWALTASSRPGARGELLRSVATLERVAQRNPENDFYWHELALTHQAVGGYFAKIDKDPAMALSFYRKSLAIRERLANQNPSNPQWQLDLVHLYQGIASMAEPWASVPSLLDINYRDHMKPPLIKPAEVIPLLYDAQGIVRRLNEAGLLIASEQRLEWHIERNIRDLECNQQGFESNLGGKCIRPLPAHAR